MRFEVGQKRIGLAAGSFFLVLSAITVGLIVIGAALISSQGTGSLPANSNSVHSSSSLGSSSVSSSTSSTTAQPAVQQANQSGGRYPLVWAPNSPTVGGCEADIGNFCIYARLGFSGTATLPPSIQTSSTTTVIQDNTTTIVFESTTTYISGISTGVVYPPENDSYLVTVFAFVQDAVTGQNVTTGSSQPYFGGLCGIQPAGFTECIAGSGVPSGHTYKVTVYVTKGDLPCSIRPASHPDSVCTSQLLAPIQTITVTE